MMKLSAQVRIDMRNASSGAFRQVATSPPLPAGYRIWNLRLRPPLPRRFSDLPGMWIVCCGAPMMWSMKGKKGRALAGYE